MRCVLRWYTRAQAQKRYTFFFSTTAFAGAFGGLLATGLAEIRYGGYNRRYLELSLSVW